MLRRLSLFFVLLLLLSFFGEAFHHHDDGADHPDCSICMAVVHHKADTGLTFAPLEIQREITGIVSVLTYFAVFSKISFTPANNRAPPA
jgi:hypothetical protein